ncbi:MAG: RlmE family RNA methyltransferase [Alphaproteobacteria bacterium]
MVIAVDRTEMAVIPGAMLLCLDFTDRDAPEKITQALGGAKVGVVLSDMAAPATGHTQTDHLRIIALCEAALAFAIEVLAPGGTFVAKVLRGGSEQSLLTEMKRAFAKVRHIKPAASRADSAEMYVVATGFRGAKA